MDEAAQELIKLTDIQSLGATGIALFLGYKIIMYLLTIAVPKLKPTMEVTNPSSTTRLNTLVVNSELTLDETRTQTQTINSMLKSHEHTQSSIQMLVDAHVGEHSKRTNGTYKWHNDPQVESAVLETLEIVKKLEGGQS